jgi:hypothetical protein
VLLDFTVVLNPDVLCQVLSDWLTELNIIMKKLNTRKYLSILQSQHSKRCRRQQEVVSNGELEHVASEFGVNVEDKEDTDDVRSGREESDPPLMLDNNVQFSGEFCNVEDPFPFSGDMLVTVKDLATKCFNSKCFHNTLDNVQPELGAVVLSDICPLCYQNAQSGIIDKTSVSNSAAISDENKRSKPDSPLREAEEGITFTVTVINESKSNRENSHTGNSVSNTEESDAEKNHTDAPPMEAIETYQDNELCTAITGSDNDLSTFVQCYFFLLDKNDLMQYVYSRESTLSDDEKFQVWEAWIQSLQGIDV